MFRVLSKSLVAPLSQRTFASSGTVRSLSALKVSVFSTKPYDKKHLDEANQGLGHTFHYYDEHLSSSTAVMAKGSTAVCTFVNDHVRMFYLPPTDIFCSLLHPSPTPLICPSSRLFFLSQLNKACLETLVHLTSPPPNLSLYSTFPLISPPFLSSLHLSSPLPLSQLDKACLETLASQGVKLIALRCAGFNQVDLVTAKALGLSVLRVPGK